jgi:hypothetical protein
MKRNQPARPTRPSRTPPPIRPSRTTENPRARKIGAKQLAHVRGGEAAVPAPDPAPFGRQLQHNEILIALEVSA